jgi:hypothetical protein
LETGSLTVELTPLKSSGACASGDRVIFKSPDDPITRSPDLFHFLVRRVLAATAAEFLELQPLRRRLPVLGSRIIPLFAIAALQRNNLSGHHSLLLLNSVAHVGPGL